MITNSTLVPEFATIKDILLLGADHTCVFVCKRFVTQSFNAHFHAYEIIPSLEVIVLKQSGLFDYHVLSQFKVHSLTNVTFVPLKYHIIENIDV